MDWIINIEEFVIPNVMIGTYIILIILHKYTKLKEKEYVVISVMSGIMISIIQTCVTDTALVKAIIDGALSGILSLSGYKAMNKYLFNRKKKER